MWRFRFGHPVTSEVTEVIEASQAQVTEAGLVVELDEWGGCKSAKWTGLTGGQQDRARVWIEAEGRTLFSGVLVRRPSQALGEREAVGDKYLRCKELPVPLEKTEQEGGNEISAEISRVLVAAALPDLPHLSLTALPDTGVKVRRRYNSESVAAALDGLLSLKKDWGWTVRPDDSFYLGPPPALVAAVNAAAPGVRLQLRDVVSEGLVNAVRWIHKLPDGVQATYESQHESVARLGRSAVSRYIDQRSIGDLIENVPASYAVTEADGRVVPATQDMLRFLRDGIRGWGMSGLASIKSIAVTPDAEADYVDIDLQVANEGKTSVGTPDRKTTLEPPTRDLRVMFPNVGAGETLTVAGEVATAAGFRIYELNPRRFRRDLLDAAAEALYRIPADHAGTLSVPGIQEPAGSVTVLRPGEPDISEKCVGTRYVLAFPARTEYLIGEPDEPVDAQVLKVLIDRRDEQAVDQAVNT